MNRESGDYAIARRAIFDDLSVEDLEKNLAESNKNNPHILEAFENRIIE